MSQSTLPRVRLSATAGEFLDELDLSQHDHQVLVMHSCCAAPSVVRVVPAREFSPKPGQARVAMVSGHPVWADEAELRTCPHGSLIIVPVSTRVGGRRLMARPDDPEGGRRS